VNTKKKKEIKQETRANANQFEKIKIRKKVSKGTRRERPLTPSTTTTESNKKKWVKQKGMKRTCVYWCRTKVKSVTISTRRTV
jgi:hypothetical protein